MAFCTNSGSGRGYEGNGAVFMGSCLCYPDAELRFAYLALEIYEVLHLMPGTDWEGVMPMPCLNTSCNCTKGLYFLNDKFMYNIGQSTCCLCELAYLVICRAGQLQFHQCSETWCPFPVSFSSSSANRLLELNMI